MILNSPQMDTCFFDAENVPIGIHKKEYTEGLREIKAESHASCCIMSSIADFQNESNVAKISLMIGCTFLSL